MDNYPPGYPEFSARTITLPEQKFYPSAGNYLRHNCHSKRLSIRIIPRGLSFNRNNPVDYSLPDAHNCLIFSCWDIIISTTTGILHTCVCETACVGSRQLQHNKEPICTCTCIYCLGDIVVAGLARESHIYFQLRRVFVRERN